MQKLFKFLIFFLLVIPAYGQRDEINRYLSQLNTARHDSDRVNIYYEVAQLYWYISPDSALLTGEKGVALATKINYRKGLSRCYFTIGSVYYYQRNFPQALHYYLETLKIGEELGITRTVSSSCFNIGMVYIDMSHYEKAKEYLQRALSVAEKNQDREVVASVLGQLGEISFLQQDYGATLEYKKKALAINRKINFTAGIADDLSGLSSTYQKMGQLEKSLRYILSAIEYYKKNNNTDGIAIAYNTIAEIHQTRGQLTESNRYARLSLTLSQVLGDKNLMSNSYQILYQNQQGLKNFEQALYYRNLEIAYRDSVFNLEKEKAVAQLQSGYELEKKQHQIALLEKNKIIQQEELDKQGLQRNGFIGGVGVLIVVSVLLWLNNREKQKINKLLQSQNHEIVQQQEEILLQNESIHQQNIRLEELNTVKNRLLSIISHDFRSPLHSLQGVVNLMQTDTLTSQEIMHMSRLMSEKLEVTLHLLENLLHWAKSQMEGMHLQAGRFDLTPVIEENRHLLQAQADKKGIVLNTHTAGPVWAYADAATVDIVIRNLVANAIKFCKAKDTVSISVSYQGEFVCVSVKDTGLGIAAEDQPKIFNPVNSFSTPGTAAEKGTGLGLALCKELVEKNGGRIWFESQPGKGTTFTFTIPKDSTGELPVH